MIPGPWVALVLALAAFRFTRLIGWDDLPPVLKLKAWATGLTVTYVGSSNALHGLTDESPQTVYAYRRPTLAHFLGCPFCQGFWVSVAVYVAWILWPEWTLYACAPFALSAVVGLTAKNLDP